MRSSPARKKRGCWQSNSIPASNFPEPNRITVSLVLSFGCVSTKRYHWRRSAVLYGRPSFSRTAKTLRNASSPSRFSISSKVGIASSLRNLAGLGQNSVSFGMISASLLACPIVKSARPRQYTLSRSSVCSCRCAKQISETNSLITFCVTGVSSSVSAH